MKLTATEFRAKLFPALKRALKGEVVEVAYQGSFIRLQPVAAASRLARVQRRPLLVNPNMDFTSESRKRLGEMEAQWEKDWSGM